MVEDDFDPEHPLQSLKLVVSPAAIRNRLTMTRENFAAALHIPLQTVQAWEAKPLSDPIALSLLALIGNDPVPNLEILNRCIVAQGNDSNVLN